MAQVSLFCTTGKYSGCCCKQAASRVLRRLRRSRHAASKNCSQIPSSPVQQTEKSFLQLCNFPAQLHSRHAILCSPLQLCSCSIRILAICATFFVKKLEPNLGELAWV